MPLIVIAVLTLLVIWWMTEPVRLTRRRQNIIDQPFPTAWRKIIQRNMPYVRSLPADLQLKLKERIQLFIAGKPFIGCRGLAIADEIRVTVTAQASLRAQCIHGFDIPILGHRGVREGAYRAIQAHLAEQVKRVEDRVSIPQPSGLMIVSRTQQAASRRGVEDGQGGKLECLGSLLIREELEIQTLGLIFAIDLNDPIFPVQRRLWMSSKSNEAVVNGGSIFCQRSLTRPIDVEMETGAKQKWPVKRLPNLRNGFSTEQSAITHWISLKMRQEAGE